MSTVLIVHAHPESRSLTSSLKDLAAETLRADGHDVEITDLYAMGWDAVASWKDFTRPRHPDRLRYTAESRHAYQEGTQRADVAAEQEKLLRADAVILSFPLWWYAEPAILKGWIDRVFAAGFAYGTGTYDATHWGDRFGEGILTGRRAMLLVTIGGRAAHYSDRGVNGRIDDILWPLQHGALFYTGVEVVDPFVVYQSDRQNEDSWPALADRLRQEVRTLFTRDRIPFRTQNGGHYDEQQMLKAGLGEGQHGNRIHLVQAGDPDEHLTHVA